MIGEQAFHSQALLSGLWVLDFLLCASLLGLAWQALATTNLFRGVILFIVFGLVLALTWARLAAPDLALAEAGIGAGLTGVLFLSTLAALRSTTSETHEPESQP